MCQKKNESDLWHAYDGHREHIIQALLLAARNGFADIVRCILQADLSVLDEMLSSNGPKLWMQAVVEGLASVYKVHNTVRFLCNLTRRLQESENIAV